MNLTDLNCFEKIKFLYKSYKLKNLKLENEIWTFLENYFYEKDIDRYDFIFKKKNKKNFSMIFLDF